MEPMVAVPMIQTELHQRILDGLSAAVLLLDDKLKLLYANPSAEMLFGMSQRYLQGTPLHELIISCEPINDLIEESISTHHPFSKHEQAVELINGKEAMVDFTVNPLQSAFGEIQILLEVTPIDRLLRISRDDNLVSQQAATQDLLRGLAHEIKNPLGGLRGAAQLLERELNSEEQKEYTRVIIDEADRLQKLVNRLLGPSGMLKATQVNLHQIIEYVRNIVLRNNKTKIKIQRDYDPSIPEIQGDPDLLIQAVLNIVNNAYEALGDSGHIVIRTRVLRKFTIGQKQARLAVKIDVIDDGPGVPEEIKEKIFFPMVTGRAEGTGLGLSITQRLIHQHGGLVECESHPGQTIFSIILPIELNNGKQ